MDREFAELKKSVQYISDSFDTQKLAIEELVAETKLLRAENDSIKRRVKELESKLNEAEQREREKNFIISGIPKQETNDMPKLVHQIARSIKVKLEEDSIQGVYRLGKRNDAPLLVKLKAKAEKSQFFQKIKELKGLKTDMCGIQGNNSKIYFNDDLTPQNQKLFKKAMESKHVNKYHSVYTRNGRVFLRKSQNEEPVRIFSEEDLTIM